MEMVHEDLSDQRVSYEKGELEEKSIKKNPFEQFKIWFDQAHDTKEIREANAMILCTASKNGFPSGRPVLLKVCFFYDSFHKTLNRSLMKMDLFSSRIMRVESQKNSKKIHLLVYAFIGSLWRGQFV